MRGGIYYNPKLIARALRIKKLCKFYIIYLYISNYKGVNTHAYKGTYVNIK